MNLSCKAVLFDWAHTLVDLGKEDDRSSFRLLYDRLSQTNGSLPDYEELYASYRKLFYELIALSKQTQREACFEHVLNYLILRYAMELGEKTTVRDLLHLYYVEMYRGRRVYSDTVPVLQALQGAGIRMGVISNTTNPGFMKNFEREQIGLAPYFEFALYSSELPYRKPHPSIFRLAIERMNLSCDDIIFVGDNLKMDIAGAQAVGMRGVWINRDGKSSNDSVSPDYEINSLEEILSLESIRI